jgi:hypothetical protein
MYIAFRYGWVWTVYRVLFSMSRHVRSRAALDEALRSAVVFGEQEDACDGLDNS